MAKGWKKEPYRHGLAGRGIKTTSEGMGQGVETKWTRMYREIMTRPENKRLDIMYLGPIYSGHKPGGNYRINFKDVKIFNPQFDKGPDPPVAVMVDGRLYGFTFTPKGVVDILNKAGIEMSVKNDVEADLIFSPSRGVSEEDDALEAQSWYGFGTPYVSPYEWVKVLKEENDPLLGEYKSFVESAKPSKWYPLVGEPTKTEGLTWMEGVAPTISTVSGEATYVGTEVEDQYGRWNQSYTTRGGYWVIHRGNHHHVYRV